jgi:hypothetical protein
MCERIRCTRAKETRGERIGVASSIFTGDGRGRVEKDVRIRMYMYETRSKKKKKKPVMELIDVLRYKINTSPPGKSI